MVQHNALTGSDLHECKGADAASANTVRVANGSGSGTWQKITADSLDASSIKNVNKHPLSFYLDPSVTTTLYVPVEQTKTLTGAFAVANTTSAGTLTCSVYKNGVLVGSSFNLTNTAGARASQAFSTSFATTDSLYVTFSGATTSTVSVVFTFSL